MLEWSKLVIDKINHIYSETEFDALYKIYLFCITCHPNFQVCLYEGKKNIYFWLEFIYILAIAFYLMVNIIFT